MSVQPPSIPLLLRLPSVLLSLHILMLDLSDAQHCYDTGNFTAASDYAKNRKLVLSSLPKKMALNGGFYSGYVGNGVDDFYVLSFCRGDSSNNTCFKCISSAAEDLMIKCPNQKVALTWGTGDPPCIIRYADVPMYGVKHTFPTLKIYNTGNVQMDQDPFDRIWRNLTEELAARASMGTSELKFAAGRTVLPNFQTMYALLQCSPDLSQIDCQSCLSKCIDDYQDCCHGRQGGVVHKPSCIFRWDLYPFFNTDFSIPLPSPPTPTAVAEANPAAPPPVNAQVTNGLLRKTFITLAAIIASVAGCCYLQRRRAAKKYEAQEERGVSAIKSLESLRAATDNFSQQNKLGSGGFEVSMTRPYPRN